MFLVMISLQLTSGEIRLVNKSKLFNQQNQPPLPDDHSQENVLEKVRVPLVGDLLRRERVTGAKKTRLGCDSSVERFENIVECPALWHTKQSFLSVSLIKC